MAKSAQYWNNEYKFEMSGVKAAPTLSADRDDVIQEFISLIQSRIEFLEGGIQILSALMKPSSEVTPQEIDESYNFLCTLHNLPLDPYKDSLKSDSESTLIIAEELITNFEAKIEGYEETLSHPFGWKKEIESLAKASTAEEKRFHERQIQFLLYDFYSKFVDFIQRQRRNREKIKVVIEGIIYHECHPQISIVDKIFSMREMLKIQEESGANPKNDAARTALINSIKEHEPISDHESMTELRFCNLLWCLIVNYFPPEIRAMHEIEIEAKKSKDPLFRQKIWENRRETVLKQPNTVVLPELRDKIKAVYKRLDGKNKQINVAAPGKQTEKTLLTRVTAVDSTVAQEFDYSLILAELYILVKQAEKAVAEAEQKKATLEQQRALEVQKTAAAKAAKAAHKQLTQLSTTTVQAMPIAKPAGTIEKTAENKEKELMDQARIEARRILEQLIEMRVDCERRAKVDEDNRKAASAKEEQKPERQDAYARRMQFSTKTEDDTTNKKPLIGKDLYKKILELNPDGFSLLQNILTTNYTKAHNHFKYVKVAALVVDLGGEVLGKDSGTAHRRFKFRNVRPIDLVEPITAVVGSKVPHAGHAHEGGWLYGAYMMSLQKLLRDRLKITPELMDDIELERKARNETMSQRSLPRAALSV